MVYTSSLTLSLIRVTFACFSLVPSSALIDLLIDFCQLRGAAHWYAISLLNASLVLARCSCTLLLAAVSQVRLFHE